MVIREHLNAGHFSENQGISDFPDVRMKITM